MNVKRNSIEAVPTFRSNSYVRCLVGAVAYEVPVRIIRLPYTTAPEAACSRDGLWALGHNVREFWETLSYAMLWICGLVGIVLSFR